MIISTFSRLLGGFFLPGGYVNPKSSACVAATLAQILTSVLFEPTSACVAATLAQTRTPVLFEQDRDELSQSAKAGRCGSIRVRGLGQ